MSILLALLMLAPCAFPDPPRVGGPAFLCNGAYFAYDGVTWKPIKPPLDAAAGKAAKPPISADNVFSWKGPSTPEPTDCSHWGASEVDGHCQILIMFGEVTKNLACMIENDGYTVKCVWDKPKKERHEDVSPKK
jgi:hypothetical protein